MPLDVGRVTHLLDQMHRSEDDAGDPITDGFLIAADGARGQRWVDPATLTGGGSGSTTVINVMDYGAVEDFSTDNATAFAAAIADMVPGCTLLFPSLTGSGYKTSATMTIVERGCRISGTGSAYGTRVHMTTSNRTLFTVTPTALDGTRNQTNVISDLTLTGPGGASSGRGVYATSDVHLENVFISGFYDGLYWANATFYSHAYACTFTDMDHAAIVMDGTNNCTVDTCRITGDFGGGGLIGALAIGIWIACPSVTGLANRVVNSSIEYFSSNGILLEGGSAVDIVGNYFETQESSTGHAHIKFSSANTNRATYIGSNYFQGDGTAGFDAIALDKCSDTVIESNRFGINSAINISSTANTTNVTLIGNYNSPAGTFSLPATAYTLDPASPPLSSGAAAGGDLSGTYPNPSVVDDSHSHTSATLPASGTTVGPIVIADTHSTPLVFADLLQTEAQDDLIYSD